MAKREKSAFALRLRTLRKKYGLTQEDVAERLNMHRTTYTKFETDKTHVDQVYLIALAELFHVTVDYLLGKEEGEVSLLRDGENLVALTPDECEFLILYRRMSANEKSALLAELRTKMQQDKL